MKHKNFNRISPLRSLWYVFVLAYSVALTVIGSVSKSAADQGEVKFASAEPEALMTGGALHRLPGLSDGHLYNAENIAITKDGRVFVTGSKHIYEILKPNGTNYTQREVPITDDAVPESCMKNGLASYGKSLYLACVHIHQGSNPDLKDLCNVADVEQTLWNLLFRSQKALRKCQIDSYLLRANLAAPRLEFADGVALHPKMQVGHRFHLQRTPESRTPLSDGEVKFFANGLAADENGALYVANSSYDAAKEGSLGILRVEVNTFEPFSATQIAWLKPEKGAPNGIQFEAETLYYTENANLSGRIIAVNFGHGEKTAYPLYRKFWSVFDDFAISGETLILADFLHDTLRFVSKQGALRGKFTTPELENPSSVAVVKKSSPLFEAGTVLVTEKGRHRLSMVLP